MIRIDEYSIKNRNGLEVIFTNLGGRILNIYVPTKNGDVKDVIVGLDKTSSNFIEESSMGAIIGRYANRIVNGQFSIDGIEYKLECNNGSNHLHGGNIGFDKRYWRVEEIEDSRFEQSYKLSLKSENGDQNYPGELDVEVIYGVTDDNQFVIKYKAVTSKPTVINLTSHSYFNLSGGQEDTIENHFLEIFSDKFTPINKEIGTVDGTIMSLENSPLDFRNSKRIGEVLSSSDEQISMFNGIDHNFVLKGVVGEVRHVATLFESVSDIKMEVLTDQPGIQVYTASHFDNSKKGKGEKNISKWSGIALETQNYPNSPNNGHFPNSILRPGEKYRHTCIYKFC